MERYQVVHGQRRASPPSGGDGGRGWAGQPDGQHCHRWASAECEIGEHGGRAHPAASPIPATRLAVDLGRVSIDGRHSWFAAHLLARRSWWRGRLLAVANAAFMGRWNIAPRSHPGDGRLYVFDTRAPPSVRWAAYRRLPSGSHVPHPCISQRRIVQAQFSFERPLDIYLDGRRHTRASHLDISVMPAALEVWVPEPVPSESPDSQVSETA